MKSKKLSGAKVLKGLIEYLIMSLEELTQEQELSPFTEGTVIAFVECLEIVSRWIKYDKYGIHDIERRFPVK